MRNRNIQQQPSPASLLAAAILGITIGNYINMQSVDLLTWLEINKGYIAGALVLFSLIMQSLGVLSLIKVVRNQDSYNAGKVSTYFLGAIIGIGASVMVLTINFIV